MRCECSDEYGPCETHGLVVAQRDGAGARRTADELLQVFVEDAVGLGVTLTDDECAVVSHVDTELNGSQHWLDDADLSEALAELALDVEMRLPDGLAVYWDDGYRIVQMVGGPLVDDDADAPEGGDEEVLHPAWLEAPHPRSDAS